MYLKDSGSCAENRVKNSRVERSRETAIKILQEMRDDARLAKIVEAEIYKKHMNFIYLFGIQQELVMGM